MELLTGQCNKDFDTWREQRYDQLIDENKTEWSYYGYSVFNELCFSMQWGVIVDFFDSVGIIISVYKDSEGYHWCIGDRDNHDGDTQKGWGYLSDFRLEARTESIKKANKLYNKKHLNNIEVQHEEIKKDGK